MLLRFIVITGIIIIYCLFTAFAVAVGVLSALKTFRKIDLDNGLNIVMDIATAITLSKEHEEKKKEICNEDRK